MESPKPHLPSDNLVDPLQESRLEQQGDTFDVSKSTEKSSSETLQTAAEASNTRSSTSVASSAPANSSPQSVYHIKWIRWKGQKTPIITQNENGPCPLIAIINVLILKGLIKLPPMMEIITTEQLMEYLGDCILSSVPRDIPESAQLNYEQNMHDAMAILPKLQTGLDVNVRFTGVKDFEYTPECIVFDLLHIPLYHGWLLDPEVPEVLAAVGNYSYNQLVEKIIINKTSPKSEIVTEALIAESFLERTASQLTYHGLCELNTTLKEEELCVLFRNNHFITLHKNKDNMYQLVTDQGFLNESNVVWETLNNVEGDGQFADSDFTIVPPKPSNITTEQQIDQDYLVALSLQQDQEGVDEKEWQDVNYSNPQTKSDEELAKQLQEEENLRASAAAQGQPPCSGVAHASASAANSSGQSNKKDCTIL